MLAVLSAGLSIADLPLLVVVRWILKFHVGSVIRLDLVGGLSQLCLLCLSFLHCLSSLPASKNATAAVPRVPVTLEPTAIAWTTTSP